MLDAVKLVDDVTLREIVADPSISQKHQVAPRHMLAEWSQRSLKNIRMQREPMRCCWTQFILTQVLVDSEASLKQLQTVLRTANSVGWEDTTRQYAVKSATIQQSFQCATYK